MDALGPNFANNCPLTPLTFLDRTATVYGDLPSIIYNDKVYTWSETHQRCIRLASALTSIGISPGDVVSAMAPNIPAMYEMHFGVPMSGAILNNINLRLDARTISVQLQHSSSKLLFVDILSLSLAKEAISLFPGSKPRPKVIVIEDLFEPKNNIMSDRTYEKLIENGNPNFRWIRPESEWTPMVLNYTSGTTSAPKGVVHCHKGLFVAAIDSVVNWFLPKNPTFLWTLPMFHSNGWCYTWGICAVGGVNVCLRRFDAAAVYEAIDRHKVTHLCGAPTVVNMLTNVAGAGVKKVEGRRVQVLSGGSPLPAAVLRRAEELGFEMYHGYGLTETAGVAVACVWKEEWDRMPGLERARMKARQGVRTVGMTEVDVVDGKSGEKVRRDGVTMGEIVMRGCNVMLGYFKDEEATRKVIRPNGWFYTGDMGVMHPDGYIEIKDRSKDIIISGGENLSSVEIESILYTHEAVNEVAVVARPDELWGETPCAFLCLKQGFHLKEDEIKWWCREKMPRFMVPKTFVFMPELPKTSTGKIQKYALRESAKKMGTVPSQQLALKSRM